MFYSHQLLARKEPLGQIWMAATLHAKMNRRKLDKINLVKICEEILNPSVPMALRLSGILLGGVAIVYERKVKLLYDDVNRMVVEINEAWKMKQTSDPTILPKSKLRAKYEAVTMDETMMMDDEHESLRHAHAPATSASTFHPATFLHMDLDSVADAYININPGDEDTDLQHNHHQADIENITLFEDITLRLQETSLFNKDDRFDTIIEEGGHTTFSQSYPEVPTTLLPSPPEPPQDGINIQREEPLQKPSSNDCKSRSEETKQGGQRRQLIRRKIRGGSNAFFMDVDQTIVPGQTYQTWIRDASDIVSRRGRKRKNLYPRLSKKVSDLMELPPVALISGFQNEVTGGINYPAPLLAVWKKFTHQCRKRDSPTGKFSALQQQQESASERQPHQEPRDFPFEDIQNGMDQMEISIEKLMRFSSDKRQPNNPMEFDFMTVGSSGHSAAGSIHSASSGQGSIQIEREFQLSSDRSKKRQTPSSRQSFGNLDPVLEENPMHEYKTNFKLRQVPEMGPTPDFELMEETGPTPTIKPPSCELALNEITRSIQTQFKMHFDKPNAPSVESLDQLARGMNRKKAAQLFYHTCVLAAVDVLKVEQFKPYGDIHISRGSKL